MIFRIFNKKKKTVDVTDSHITDNMEPFKTVDNKTDQKLVQPKEEFNFSEDEIQFLIEKEAQKKILEQLPDIQIDNDPFFYNYFSDDSLLIDAARLIVIHQQGSTSLIQRKFAIGYARAGRLMDELERLGIVSSMVDSKPRTVITENEKDLDRIFNIYSLNKEKVDFFKNNIFPDLTHKVEEIVNSYFENRNRELEKQLKEEILQEEKERIEKKRIKELKEQLKKELLKEGYIENLEENNDNRRSSIPKDVQNRVWNRDNGRCVVCGNNEKLEFDHIIPFSKGGANTYRNLQLLCEQCNRKKSNKIG